MNDNNLIPNSERSPNEVRENGRKGGKRSGDVRRAKKTMRETCEMLLAMDCKIGNIKTKMKEIGIPENEQTNQMAITISMLKSALNGNVQAFNSLRDTMGEKPTTCYNHEIENKEPIVFTTTPEIKELIDKL